MARSPLTWQNVAAPDFRGAAELFKSAREGFNQTGESLIGLLDTTEKKYKDEAALQFEKALLQRQGDPEQLQRDATSGAVFDGIPQKWLGVGAVQRVGTVINEALSRKQSQLGMENTRLGMQKSELDLSETRRKIADREYAEGAIKENPGILKNLYSDMGKGDWQAVADTLANLDPRVSNHLRDQINIDNTLKATQNLKAQSEIGDAAFQKRFNSTAASLNSFSGSINDYYKLLDEQFAPFIINPVTALQATNEKNRLKQLADKGGNGGTLHIFTQAEAEALGKGSPSSTSATNSTGSGGFSPTAINAIPPSSRTIVVGGKAHTADSGTIGQAMEVADKNRMPVVVNGEPDFSTANGIGQATNKTLGFYGKRIYGTDDWKNLPNTVENQLKFISFMKNERTKEGKPDSFNNEWAGLKRIAGAGDPKNWEGIPDDVFLLTVANVESGQVTNPVTGKPMAVPKNMDEVRQFAKEYETFVGKQNLTAEARQATEASKPGIKPVQTVPNPFLDATTSTPKSETPTTASTTPAEKINIEDFRQLAPIPKTGGKADVSELFNLTARPKSDTVANVTDTNPRTYKTDQNKGVKKPRQPNQDFIDLVDFFRGSKKQDASPTPNETLTTEAKTAAANKSSNLENVTGKEHVNVAKTLIAGRSSNRASETNNPVYKAISLEGKEEDSAEKLKTMGGKDVTYAQAREVINNLEQSVEGFRNLSGAQKSFILERSMLPKGAMDFSDGIGDSKINVERVKELTRQVSSPASNREYHALKLRNETATASEALLIKNLEEAEAAYETAYKKFGPDSKYDEFKLAKARYKVAKGKVDKVLSTSR